MPFYKKQGKSKQPSHLKKLLKQKICHYKQSKLNSSYKQVYKQVSKEYDIAVSQWYDQIESAVCDSQNPNSFYSYSNRKLKDKSFIPSLKKASGEVATSDIAKAK